MLIIALRRITEVAHTASACDNLFNIGKLRQMNEDDMQLNLLPESLEDKELIKDELNRYFSNTSIEDLVLQLRYLSRNHYLNFHVLLDKSYLAFLEQRQTLALRTDGNFTGLSGFGFNFVTDDYGLDSLHRKAASAEPLTEAEIVLVASKLPEELSSMYLRYKLFNIDWAGYEELVTEHPANKASAISYARVEYNGLVIDGTDVAFLGKPIRLSVQHREALRVLLEEQGGLCFRDDFFEHSKGIFKRDISDYANPYTTLRHMISDLRTVLKQSIGRNVIHSVAGEGYKLVI